MAENSKWSVIFVYPGEEELSLLAELSARDDTRIVGLIDPDGQSLGAGLSELLGLEVYPSLAAVPASDVKYLIHPTVNDKIATLIEPAAACSLTPLTAATFQALLVKSALTGGAGQPLRKPRVHLDSVEAETTSIHRTLSRIEEALDRESLLRWLLGLATRATGAGSGSLMLYDEAAGELYVAFAHGLSQTTMHRTRVKLGEGVAGRVAATGRAELIRDVQHPGTRRDRSDIAASICAPIHVEDRLLGVINISTTDGEGDLAPNAMDIIGSLTHRFGTILDRFLRLQTVNDGDLIQNLERAFSQGSLDQENPAQVMVDWAVTLANLVGAEQVRFSLLTNDGDLLSADIDGLQYQSPPPADMAAVLASGNPVVLRPREDGFRLGDDDATLFHLPIGKDLPRALLSIGFKSYARAHYFHTISPDVLFTVGNHLNTLLDRLATDDQLDRLTTLSSALSDLAAAEIRNTAEGRHRLLTAACHLTGARQASLLQGPSDQDTCEGTALSDDLRAEASRLLHQAGDRGWQSSILTVENGGGPDSPRRSIMVVPLVDGDAFPGLVLLDKKRLEPLDGASFTEFDALFVRRLVPLLMQTPDTVEFVPPVPPAATGPALITAATACAVGTDDLMDLLRREIDRCDRYHNMLGLVAVQVTPPTGPAPEIPLLVEFLAQKLRTSDLIGWLTDGTILIIVPEDIQSLTQLQTRISSLLIGFTGQEDLLIRTASRVFPGGGKDADDLIATLRTALSQS